MKNKQDETRNHIILDSIADGVFTVDRDWIITSFNKAAEKIIGISRKDAVGHKCWEIFHTEICEQECLLKKTLRSGRSNVNRTVQIINKSGKQIPISISTAILRDDSGRSVGGVETFRDISEIEELRKEISGRHNFADIITKDHKLLSLLNTIPVIAKTDSPVLLLGESGTGKELLAKAVHNLSTRAKNSFIAVNCGALPENLLESELFGYKKGAFTDAKADKPGRFDRAQGGTIFLDEIGDLPRSLQVKLLRVLQEKMYEPLGSTEPVLSDVRIIAATNRNLQEMISSGEFRQDLYYRINVMSIQLPPLRERLGDIPLLIEHFLTHFNTVYKKAIQEVSSDTLAVLMNHCYPGNIRELENILQHAIVLCQDTIISHEHLPAYLFVKTNTVTESNFSESWESFEKSRIEKALLQNRFNKAHTAKELGIHPSTLWRKMQKFRINS